MGEKTGVGHGFASEAKGRDKVGAPVRASRLCPPPRRTQENLQAMRERRGVWGEGASGTLVWSSGDNWIKDFDLVTIDIEVVIGNV